MTTMLNFLKQQMDAPITFREGVFFIVRYLVGIIILSCFVNQDKIKVLKRSFRKKAGRIKEIIGWILACMGLYVLTIYYGFRFNLAVTPHSRKKYYGKTCRAAKCLEQVQWRIGNKKGGR